MDELEVLTPEQAQEVLQEKLQNIYAGMSEMRDEWVRHRAQCGVETRWRKAAALYEGRDATDEATGLESVLRNGPGKRSAARRSKVVVNIVAPKIDAAVARLCEILLPVDDRNWGIRPTPDPELMEDMQSGQQLMDPSTGMTATLGEAARAKRDQIQKASEAMTRKIDDVLTECGYNGELRRVIFDAAKLGSGILKGPAPVIARASVYQPTPGGYMKMVSEKLQPASVWIDPWNVYFDPSCGNDHQRGRGVWEKRDVTRKELRALIGIPGYDEQAIREVLREKPRRVRTAESRVIREDSSNDAFELWEYQGEVEPEEFGALSIRTNLTDDAGDPLMVSNGVLVMVNDRVIGALEPWWDEDYPYDVFTWHEADDSPFGYGIADRTEVQQRVVNAAWRQVMDNAGYSAGGQVVVQKHLIEPANGSWEIEALKVWLGREDLDDARKAFHIVEFPDRLQNLMAIAQAAMQFADQESNLPLLMQGDQGSAPDTVGGMTMLMNAANSPLRHRVKLFDDYVTRPHLKRYYDWFMANDEDAAIKGDFEVDARGSTTLIERDIQNQAMLNVAQLTMNPVYGPLLQSKALPGLRAILKSFKLDPDEFLPSDEEFEQQQQEAAQQPAQQDPKIVAAQIMAQTKQAELADRQADRQLKAQIEQQSAQERAATIQYNSQREQGEYEIAMAQTQNDRDIAFAKLANERNMSVEQLMQQWKIKSLEIDHERQLFNAEAQLKARMGSGI